MKTCACGQPSRPQWHHSERRCHGMAVTADDIRALRFAAPVLAPLQSPNVTPAGDEALEEALHRKLERVLEQQQKVNALIAEAAYAYTVDPPKDGGTLTPACPPVAE